MSALDFLPYAVAAWLFLIALYGIVTSRNLIHLVICLSVAQSSTYLVLIERRVSARRSGADFQRPPPGTPAVDPVGQALVLTDSSSARPSPRCCSRSRCRS